MEMNLEQFNPTLAELNRLAEESRGVTITNWEDPKEIEIVHKQRMTLKNVRVAITKKGKDLREEALTFQKAVIAKEKELINIIEPEETRLEALEEQVKIEAIKRERERKWPERLERLKEIEFVPGTSDTHVLTQMTDLDFEAFISNAKAKMEAEALARQRTEQLAREAELKRREEELEAKERKAKYDEEVRQNAEREKADAEMREKRRLADLEAARLEGERLERERVKLQEETEKAERAKAEKARKFKVWLTLNGCTEATRGEFSIQYEGGKTVLYKRIGVYGE